jgi:hypothetical protein
VRPPVIHLAWLIQPSRDERELERGQRARHAPRVPRGGLRGRRGARARVLRRRLLARPRRTARSTSRGPTNGIPTSFYSRPQGRRGARARRIERANPGCASSGCAPASSSAGGRVGDPPVFAALPALAAGCGGAVARRARHPRLRFRPCTRMTWGEALPPARSTSAPAAPTTSPRARARPGDARRGARLRVGCRCPPARCGCGPLASWKARLQPTPPGWVDLGSACRSWTRAGSGGARLVGRPLRAGCAPRARPRHARLRRAADAAARSVHGRAATRARAADGLGRRNP